MATPEVDKILEELGWAQKSLRAFQFKLEKLREQGVIAEGQVVEARVKVEEIQARLAEATKPKEN
jgi:hypothetical protein